MSRWLSLNDLFPLRKDRELLEKKIRSTHSSRNNLYTYHLFFFEYRTSVYMRERNIYCIVDNTCKKDINIYIYMCVCVRVCMYMYVCMRIVGVRKNCRRAASFLARRGILDRGMMRIMCAMEIIDFYSRSGKTISKRYIWDVITRCVHR